MKSHPVDLPQQDKLHHMHPATNPVQLRKSGPLMIARAEGAYIYTPEGRKILDACSSLMNVNIGYANERVCDAASAAMRRLCFSHTFLGRTNPYVAALSDKLAQITPAQFQSFFFASSGSEANDSAIKMVWYYWRLRGKPEKRLIIARRGGYHGNTTLTASLSGAEALHAPFGLPIAGVVHHTAGTNWYRDGNGRSKEEFFRDLLRTLEKEILEIGPARIAAFIGEPIQTGHLIPEPLYWRGVRELCDRYEILLIADEVVSGFGKTGKMFAIEHFDYEPDLITMAKGITSGYFPLSAVAVGAKVGEVVGNDDAMFMTFFTNSGHPVAAAVALENLAVLEEEGLIDRVRDDIGPYFHDRLNELLEFDAVGEVRSLGVLGAFEFDLSRTGRTVSKGDNDAAMKRVLQAAWERGLYVRGPEQISLPMIITRAQIDELIGILKISLAEVLAG